MRRWLCSVCFLAVLPLFPASLRAAQGTPVLWGAGVAQCGDFVAAWEADRTEDRRPYRDWLAGFASGLNLATGEDVFGGESLEAVMRRLHIYCDDHSDEDFFNASMAVIRTLRGGAAAPSSSSSPGEHSTPPE